LKGKGLVLLAGSVNMDMVCRLPTLPVPGETVLCHDFTAIPGGKGANQATALARLGARVTMLAAVGNDAYGSQLLEGLRVSGVDTSLIHVCADTPTGMAYIEVDANGQNRIVVAPGANSRVDEALVRQAAVLAALDEADYLVMQLEIPLPTVVFLAREAKKRGVTVILNPAPMPDDLPASLLADVDILVPNETELARLTGRAVTIDTTEEEARGVLARGVGSALVTLGDQGALWILPDETLRFDALPVIAVDTTAAGDTFIGGLVAALARGENRQTAGEFAAKAAAISVSRKGAQSSIPTLEEVPQ